MVMECLSVLSDLLRRYPTLVQDHDKIQKAIMPHLTSTRDASRKKAISCLGYWSISTSDALFADLITCLLNEIQSAKKANYIRTLISVIGAIRSVYRRRTPFFLLIRWLYLLPFASALACADGYLDSFQPFGGLSSR